MTEETYCDVLVIGAGPAGSTSARAAAADGARVVLLERKAVVGTPVQCAGYVAKAIRWHIDLPASCIAQPVDRLRTYLPDGTVQEVEAPGYVLDRAALDRRLAREAIGAGARLLLGTHAVQRCEDGVVVRREGRISLIRAKVIIGADGPRSLVARWMGLPSPRLAKAVQYEMPLRRRLDTAEVYFRPCFRGGYGWLFPAGETARVGAAFVNGGREGLANLGRLRRELEDGGKIAGLPLSTTSGFVPVSGPKPLHRENMLLVGDAAGHTHPITGAGILNAIIAGDLAGRIAAQAAAAGDLDILRDYEEEWSQIFGAALNRAVGKRSHLEEAWDLPPVALSQAIRQSWITFDEYYR